MAGIVIVALSLIGGYLVSTVDMYAGLALMVAGGGVGLVITWIELS